METNTTQWRYQFSELSLEVQKVVIEGHSDFLNLTGKYDYHQTVSNLNEGKYVFDMHGNVIDSAKKG
jgi:hypothetical protein